MKKGKLRFYSGEQVMRHYIPGYDEGSEPAGMEEEIRRFVEESINKLDRKLVSKATSRRRLPSARKRRPSARKRASQSGTGK